MNTTVNTKQGAIQGAWSQDGKTAVFRGVPYAQPPVGDLRFRRPQEHQPWEGTLDSPSFLPAAPRRI